MTILTFGQAARLTSLGKTTLARAIRSGRLGRVYPFPPPLSTPPTRRTRRLTEPCCEPGGRDSRLA